MQTFSFIVLLAYDVYVKKLLIEKILDNITEADTAAKAKEKSKGKDKSRDKDKK